jgi:replication-associated recombination protein RarA
MNGPGTCGKTSLAKYIAGEFGYRMIEFEVEAGVAK